MWQLSIYCAPIPNPPFALPCNSRTRPYKQSSLPASTMLGALTRGQLKGQSKARAAGRYIHQGSSPLF